jgi:hypothetical protein
MIFNIKSAQYLCEIRTGKKYQGIGQEGGREKQREHIKRRERRSIGGNERWHG